MAANLATYDASLVPEPVMMKPAKALRFNHVSVRAVDLETSLSWYEQMFGMTRIAAPMVGGMVSATVLTLVIIPSLYLLLNGWKLRDERG